MYFLQALWCSDPMLHSLVPLFHLCRRPETFVLMLCVGNWGMEYNSQVCNLMENAVFFLFPKDFTRAPKISSCGIKLNLTPMVNLPYLVPTFPFQYCPPPHALHTNPAVPSTCFLPPDLGWHRSFCFPFTSTMSQGSLFHGYTKYHSSYSSIVTRSKGVEPALVQFTPCGSTAWHRKWLQSEHLNGKTASGIRKFLVRRKLFLPC